MGLPAILADFFTNEIGTPAGRQTWPARESISNPRNVSSVDEPSDFSGATTKPNSVHVAREVAMAVSLCGELLVCI